MAALAAAVVMAAGEGTRLRPLTERWPKPMLPIDGRAVISTLLRELSAAGIEHAVVVTGHLAEQVEELAGSGAFGLDVSFVRQPRADGSADAVRRAPVTPPFLITAADTVYTAGDVGRFISAWAASGADGALAVRRDPPPSPQRPPVESVDGRITRIVSDDFSIPLGSAPLWVAGESVASRLHDVPGPPFELRDAFQGAIDAGNTIIAVEIGKTRDLTHLDDLARENFAYLR